MNKIAIILGCAAMAATANAGIQFYSDTNSSAQLMSNFASVHNGGTTSNLVLNNVNGTHASALSFGSSSSALNPSQNGMFTSDVTTKGGNFYFGLASGLSDGYYNAGETGRPADDTITLAFGTSPYSADDLTLDFGMSSVVTAFGFVYEDVGDGGGTLSVSFNEGSDVSLDLSTFGADGYISIVSDFGSTISSITLTKNNSANDGYTFYGFQTVQVVPVPTAALAGLGLLGGLGVARRIRRR